MHPHTIYSPADRPSAEVEVDGQWHTAEVRMWLRDDGGAWHAQVTWNRGPGVNFIDTFPAALVRPVEDDDARRP